MSPFFDPDASDLELYPITFFKVVNAPIEREQKLEPVFGSPVIYIISCDDIVFEFHLPGKWSGTPSADVHQSTACTTPSATSASTSAAS